MPSSIITRPADDEFAPYYAQDIAEVPVGDVLATLERDLAETLALLRATPEDRGAFRYVSTYS